MDVRPLLRQHSGNDPLIKRKDGTDRAHHGRLARQAGALPQSINGFDPGAMRAHQVRDFELFEFVSSPVQLFVGGWEQVQTADDCENRSRGIFCR